MVRSDEIALSTDHFILGFGVISAIGALFYFPLINLGILAGCVALLRKHLGGLGVVILSIYIFIVKVGLEFLETLGSF